MIEITISKLEPYSIRGKICQNDINEAILVIDELINNGEEAHGPFPSQQTTPILFEDQRMIKFKTTFEEACAQFIQSSEYELNSTCWAYINWHDNSLTINRDEQWHTHPNTHLSGILYLSVPDRHLTSMGGTEFIGFDGKVEWLEPITMAWWVFPSSRIHRPGIVKTNNKRYVLAATTVVVEKA